MKKELNRNTMHTLRALIKISSSLHNADEIIDSKVYKQRLKQALPAWLTMVEKHTEETMTLLVKEDSETTITLIKYIDDYSKDYFILDTDRTNLWLLYSKLKSATRDFERMDSEVFDNAPFLHHLKTLCERMVLIIEKQFNYMFKFTDSQGVPITRIVEIFDEVAQKLMFFDKTNQDE